MPAGLPSFAGLAKGIIDKLGSKKAIEPYERGDFDRAFNALFREFGRDEIDLQVFNALRAPKNPDLKNHQNLLTLSRSADGRPQIVTTNFDLLFERAESGIRASIPPILPNLELNQSIDGLVYLHGRLISPQSTKLPAYVVSSSDFGRAYLSEGWAASFVKSLREQFAIVLVGYRAEDPPMRYLLEGLHSAIEHRYSHPIYAFTPGDAEEAEELWSERGVTPIPYTAIDGNHDCLWNTIEAWADSVKSPDKWTNNVISLAQRPPHEVQPYERGQVCFLISNKEGAKAFAQADPPALAEWLCVFDHFCRYAEPQKISWDDPEEIDPLNLYGLDDDPPRPIKEGAQKTNVPGRDYLAWNSDDESFDDRIHLAAWTAEFSSRLPARLEAVARWFRRCMDEPATIWWAAGRANLHPNLIWHIRRKLEENGDQLSRQSKSFWRYYLVLTDRRLRDAHDLRWYELKSMIKSEGWGRQSLRLFEDIIEPYIAVSRNSLKAPRPPSGSWDDLELQNVIELKVEVLDRHGDKLNIPDKYLSDVVKLIRRSLIDCSILMNEVGQRWWSSPTLHPTQERGESFHGKMIQNYLWFKSLFDRLLEADETSARQEFQNWNCNDPTFFGKLCIYYAGNIRLLKRSEAFSLISGLADKIFWDRENQRELLFTIKELWPDFNLSQRQKIEQRIIKGPNKWTGEQSSEFKLRKATNSASRLRWLQLNGCVISASAEEKLNLLKSVDDRWTDEWARTADDSLGSRGGMIARVTEPQGLEILPISKIILAAERKTEDRFRELTDYRPFVGLVEVAPFKALSALRQSLKKGEFPEQFWENILSEWPDNTSVRLRWLLAETIAKLEPDNARKLKHYVPDWLKKQIVDLAASDRAKALSIYDRIAEVYLTAAPDLLSSGVGTTTIGGVPQERSEVSISKAINSPGGKLAEALWALVPKPRKGRSFPEYLDIRFERLFNLPGDGGGHAVAVISQRLGWLDYWFNHWVQDTLLPLFNPENGLSEAAWHGLAYDRNGLSHSTLQLMNAYLLDVLKGNVNWVLDQQEYRQHIHRLVALSQPDLKHGAIIKFSDAKSVLMAIDDLGRSEAVAALSNIMQAKGNWRAFVKPFLCEAWPKQLIYKGEMSSRAFASLLAESGEDFPDAVKVILPLLRPVSHLDMFAHYLMRDEDDKHDYAKKFPGATLSVLGALIDENKPTVPYELPKVLDTIAEIDPALKRTTIWRRLKELSM